MTAGCASWQLPRIDPSGERLLIWPNQAPPTPTFAPPVAAPSLGAPFGAPFGAPLVPAPTAPATGNIQAAPVYPDVPATPLAPPPTTGGFWNPFTPTVVGPPVATVPGVPGAPPARIGAPTAPPLLPAGPVAPPAGVVAPPPGAVPIGQDYLRVTPDRVLAPVGSEVVLKAGICGADGYLTTDERVEWLLERDGAGQFVELGERDEVNLFRWSWDTPRKIDNWYAIGMTTCVPLRLRRGNADPRDDVPIAAGEAWVSVSSATEGTSHVTAYAPSVDSWQFRRTTATIYWVDAQWVVPPPATVEPGRPHVLTTAVNRRTDGAPLAGWIVRYDVAGGGASLGYANGDFVEVPTDAAGRASVEVSPVGVDGGSTTIGVTIIRPAMAGPNASPQLEVGRGSTTITWGAAQPPTPISSGPPLSPTPQPILPSEPPAADTGPLEPFTPPPDEAPTGPPRLDAVVTNVSGATAAVGGTSSFEVTVTNRGETPARGILVLDRYPPGLRHPDDRLNELAVKYEGMRDLAAGESASVTLEFEVLAAGEHCHTVTVSAEGAESASGQACVRGVAATLDVRINGPRRRVVGETAEFDIAIQNNGDVPATNVEIIHELDPAYRPMLTDPGMELLPDKRVRMRILRINPRELSSYRLNAECIAPRGSACHRVTVSADGGVIVSADNCPEIVDRIP